MKRRSPGNGSPGTIEDALELTTSIVFLHHKNFATTEVVVCKLRAEWTFSPKPGTLES
jgi:hypothetical protein